MGAQVVAESASGCEVDVLMIALRDRFRESPYDTSVFLLQNEAGHAKWAPPPDIELQLRQAFATGVPTQAAIDRRMKDGRGFADQDGGGGEC